MKTGIVILFKEYNELIDPSFFIDHISLVDHIGICFVINNCENRISEHLNDIADYCTNVSALNINKLKPDDVAIRAGVRYLVSQNRFKDIAVINTNLLNKQENIKSLLETTVANTKAILKYKQRVYQHKKIKEAFFQNVFSLIDCVSLFNTSLRAYNL